MTATRRMIVSAYLAFAAFGAFWGVWGASVPRVQQQAGVGDGQLGVALLFVGAGALPAMLLTGRALDRWGLTVAAVAVAALGVAGAGLAYTAADLAALCAGLALVGATSGAADVAMNAVAGRAETVAGRPVITRAHGVFSSFVVVGSLATGVASGLSVPLGVPFVAVAALSVAAGAALRRTLPDGVAPRRTAPARVAPGRTPSARVAPDRAPPDDVAPAPTPAARLAPGRTPPDGGAPGRTMGGAVRESGTSPGRRGLVPLVLIGVLGALAFASENAHQSWSAVFAHDELGAGAGLSAVAPAVFAATVAVTRFCAGGLGAGYARTVLLAGALAAAAGAAVIAAAPTLVVAGLGLALAAAGTSVLFPTLVGIVSRAVDESRRGRATSVVTAVSYLGFLVGPVYVGLWADGVGLRGAMVAVAALGAGLFALTPALLRLGGIGAGGNGDGGPRRRGTVQMVDSGAGR